MKVVALFLAALPLFACASAAPQKASAPVRLTAAQSAPQARSYVVGGRVKGLEGIGLALSNEQGQEIQVEDDGRFVFRRLVADGSEFNVTILRQPISPPQTCVLEHGSGHVKGKNALDVNVVCTTVSFDAAPPAPPAPDGLTAPAAFAKLAP